MVARLTPTIRDEWMDGSFPVLVNWRPFHARELKDAVTERRLDRIRVYTEVS
jgi:hypothetical protein